MRHGKSTAAIGIGVVLLGLAAIPLSLLFQIRNLPPAIPIFDKINVTDPSGRIVLKSIEMAAQPVVTLGSLVEAPLSSSLNVEIENLSKTEVSLGFEYYADSGSMGLFSPGTFSKAWTIRLPPEWSGSKTFPIHHAPFAYGGYLQTEFAICKPGQDLDGSFLPPDAETILKKKYILMD